MLIRKSDSARVIPFHPDCLLVCKYESDQMMMLNHDIKYKNGILTSGKHKCKINKKPLRIERVGRYIIIWYPGQFWTIPVTNGLGEIEKYQFPFDRLPSVHWVSNTEFRIFSDHKLYRMGQLGPEVMFEMQDNRYVLSTTQTGYTYIDMHTDKVYHKKKKGKKPKRLRAVVTPIGVAYALVEIEGQSRFEGSHVLVGWSGLVSLDFPVDDDGEPEIPDKIEHDEHYVVCTYREKNQIILDRSCDESCKHVKVNPENRVRCK